MTLYHVKVEYAGRTFERAFDSMTARALFAINAAKFGAHVIEEWTDAGADLAPVNERIVTDATRKWLGA